MSDVAGARGLAFRGLARTYENSGTLGLQVRAQSGAARRRRLRQGGRDEVRRGGRAAFGRPYLLHTLWPSAQRYLYRSLSSPSLPVRQAEPAAWVAALLQLRRQAHRRDNPAEMLRAVAPIAIEAAAEAERMLRDEDKHRRRIAELELQQAQYDASLAERRYAACDPDNRLIAAQLEKAWEAALQRVEICRQRLDGMPEADAGDARPDLTGLADDLSAAWAPKTTMRTRQRLVRALITEIVADVDETAGEIVLVIHWKGGQHSELRVRKPRTGEHGCSTPEQALAVIAQHGWPMVRSGHRRINEPNGNADRPRQDLDGEACRGPATRAWYSRLPLRR